MAKTRSRKSNLPVYDHPPVVETVYGVKFIPLKGWMLPHIGAFWQRVSDRFPRCHHLPPIGVGASDVADPATGLPLPRVLLISGDDDRLIQLQSGRFFFNWRHREKAGAYPRYETLSQSFFELFRDFRSFVDENDLGDIEAQEYELTYINRIADTEGWRFPEHTGRVVNQLAWQDPLFRFLPRPSTMSWQAKFAFQEAGGALTVKLSQAVEHAEDHRQLLVLELSARGLPAEAPLDRMEDWFSHAHEWIVRGFEDLASDEAQNELWGKHE